MEVKSFSELEQEFLERVYKYVWCNAATVDGQNRPRSRIIHPIWQGTQGWITTRRSSHKGKHLAKNPFISLAYVSDLAKPVYVDCTAVWDDDLADKQLVWDFVKNTPPPMGFDPVPIYERVDHPNFGLLKLTPWRIEVATIPTSTLVWHAP